MRTEAPQFKRCCFCIPLRRGLIGWGYIKLALNGVMLAYLIFICCLIWEIMGYMRTMDFVIFTLMFAFFLADTGFNILFVVAGHKKSIKLLKISYIYNIVSLVLFTLSYVLKLCGSIYYHVYRVKTFGVPFRMVQLIDLLLTAAFAVGVIAVQIYLILLIRSEMVKLQNQTLEMQFSNHLAADELQCTLHAATSQRENRTVQCMGGNYDDKPHV